MGTSWNMLLGGVVDWRGSGGRVKAAVTMVAGNAVTGNQGARRIEVEERARGAVMAARARTSRHTSVQVKATVSGCSVVCHEAKPMVISVPRPETTAVKI